MKNLLLILLALTFIPVGSFAQMTFWVKGGVNISGTTFNDKIAAAASSSLYRISSTTSSKTGYYGGVAMDIRFEKFSVRPEVLYTELSSQWIEWSDDYYATPPIHENQRVTQTESRRYIMIPVQLIYHFRLAHLSFQAGLGGYVSKALTGHYSFTNTETDLTLQKISYTTEGDLKPGKDPNQQYPSSAYYNPYDAGLNASLGWVVRRLLVNVQYQYGLANTQPYAEPSTYERDKFVTQNRNLAIGLSYRISKD